MRVSAPLLERVQKLARKVAHGDGDKLVFIDPHGAFDCCPAAGVRAEALLKFKPPRYVVVGRFPVSVSAAELAKAIRDAQC